MRYNQIMMYWVSHNLSGVFCNHISTYDVYKNRFTTLCGLESMDQPITLDDWGDDSKSLYEGTKWCEDCYRRYLHQKEQMKS